MTLYDKLVSYINYDLTHILKYRPLAAVPGTRYCCYHECWWIYIFSLNNVEHVTCHILLETYHRFSLRNASQEDKISYEETDAEVQVDGGAGSLYGTAELESQDAECETQQGDGQSYFSHQLKPIGVLEEKTISVNVSAAGYQ